MLKARAFHCLAPKKTLLVTENEKLERDNTFLINP